MAQQLRKRGDGRAVILIAAACVEKVHVVCSTLGGGLRILGDFEGKLQSSWSLRIKEGSREGAVAGWMAVLGYQLPASVAMYRRQVWATFWAN